MTWYCDGSADNAKQDVYGFGVVSPRGDEHGGRGFIPEDGCKATNNYAEYIAMEHAIDLSPDDTTIATDSMLVVKQLNGEWRCKNANIHPVYLRCKKKKGNRKIIHVRRENNKISDMIASGR